MTKKLPLCVLHNAFAVEKRTTHRYVAYVLLELKLFSVHVNEVDACLSLCNVIGKVADLVFTEPSIPVDTFAYRCKSFGKWMDVAVFELNRESTFIVDVTIVALLVVDREHAFGEEG